MIIPREKWSARPKLGGTMKKPAPCVTIHHAPERHLDANATGAREREQLLIMENFHINERKWLDLGYNSVFFQSGRGYEGRGWGRVGAHAGTTAGNETSYGILVCVNGNAVSGADPMWAAVADHIREGISQGWISKNPIVKGHLDWKATECPGRLVYAEGLPKLRRLLQAGATPAAPAVPPKPGAQVFSGHYSSDLTLVLFKGDGEWHFTVNADPLRHGIVRAATPWSRMPSAT
jgi:peptidoglycan recognition protein